MSNSSFIKLFDFETGILTKKISYHNYYKINSFIVKDIFSTNGGLRNLLYIISQNGFFSVLNLNNYEKLYEIKLDNSIYDLRELDNGDVIICGKKIFAKFNLSDMKLFSYLPITKEFEFINCSGYIENSNSSIVSENTIIFAYGPNNKIYFFK